MSEPVPRSVGGRPPSPWRRRRRVVAAVALLLVVAALWWYRPWAEHVGDGDVVELDRVALRDPADSSTDDERLLVARRTRVVVPSGAFEVQVGDRVASLPEEVRSADEEGSVEADRGSSFVPITWGYDGPAPLVLVDDDPLGDRADVAIGEGDATLVLRVDGEAVAGPYDLDGDGGGAQVVDETALAVAAADDAEVEVAVTFDDVEQVVDAATGDLDAGLAAAYYTDVERAPRASPPCSWDVELPPDADAQDLGCAAEAYASPWIPESGWVESAGQTWVQVALTAGGVPELPRSGTAAYPYDRYYPEGRLARPRLGASSPEAVDRAPPDQRDTTLLTEVESATWLLDERPGWVEVAMTGSLRLGYIDDSGFHPGRERSLGLVFGVRVHG